MSTSPATDTITDPTTGPTTGPATGPGEGTRRPGLSPSRANDFQQCPLLFRFRAVDRLPEPPSTAAARGTLVHATLEALFDLPTPDRTRVAATRLLDERWAHLQEQEPALSRLFDDPAQEALWLDSARDLLGTWFTLEDPTRLAPRARELRVEHQLDDGPQLRGIIDRVDVAPNGWVRIVDYKTGRSPTPGFEGSALFQMRFYAYVVWRTRQVLPRLLQLVYLGDGVLVRHEPTPTEMATFEARVRALWASIEETARSGHWQPRQSALCGWCAFRDRCPQFGGTPPELPPGAVERTIGVRAA